MVELNDSFHNYVQRAKAVRLATASTDYCMFGLFAEAGEFAGHVAKEIRDTHDKELTKTLAKELGDILWFVAMLADDLGYSLEEIAAQNIEKLESRKNRNTLQGSGDNR